MRTFVTGQKKQCIDDKKIDVACTTVAEYGRTIGSCSLFVDSSDGLCPSEV